MSLFVRESDTGYNEWYIYLLTIVSVALALAVGQLPAYIIVNRKLASGLVDPAIVENFWNSPDFSLLGIPSSLGLVLLMAGHIVAALVLIICVRTFHKRKLISVVTTRRPFDIRRFAWAFAVWMILTATLEVVMYLIDPSSYAFRFEWSKWFPLLAVCILVVPIQTSIEEIFVRGYLFQGIGRLTRSALASILLTSVFFVLMHMSNPEIARFGYTVMIIYYMLVAIFLAIITYLDDGLELALGVHAATNIYGAAFVTFDGSVLQTDAIARVYDVNAWWMTAGFIIMIGIFWLLVQRKYHLRPLSSILELINLAENNETELLYDKISHDPDPGGADRTSGI